MSILSSQIMRTFAKVIFISYSMFHNEDKLQKSKRASGIYFENAISGVCHEVIIDLLKLQHL